MTIIKHTLINKKQIQCSEFNYIIHISDIHVRPLERHNEYNHVFNNVLSYVKKHKNTAVAITGDVFDNKTVFKPETFFIVKKFFKDLSLLAPVFVIAGNHDMLESNIQRMDALTPTVGDIPNVFYFSLSGVYRVNKYNFVCLSLQDKNLKETLSIIKSHLKSQSNKVVTLYHGTLQEAIPNPSVEKDHLLTKEDFNFSNITLLGDIHKRQLLKNNIGYAGSLIQQNFGEPLEDHGGLLWNIENESAQMFNIENDYGFGDIIINSGTWTNKHNKISKHLYARLIIDSNTTEHEVQEVIKQVHKKTDSLVVSSKQYSHKNNTKETKTVTNLNETEMIKKECENIKSSNTDFILSLHDMYKKEALTKDDNIYYSCVWKPEKIEFKNLFGYSNSKVHNIDLDQGIYTLNAPNGHGKTSIINVLLFGIYGKTPLVPFGRGRTYDILNNNESNGYVCIYFDFNNVKYILRRENKQLKQTKHDNFINSKLQSYTFSAELFECGNSYLNENKKKVSETGNSTDEILLKMFGDIDYFLHSNMLDKECSKDIASSTAQTERLKILKKVFHLDYYDDYKNLNMKNMKNIKANRDSRLSEIKGMESIYQDNSEEDLSNKQQETIKKVQSLTTILKETAKEKKNLEDQYQTLNSKIEINNIKIKNNNEPYSKELFEKTLNAIKKSDYYKEEKNIPQESCQTIKSKIQNLENLNNEYLKHVSHKNISQESITNLQTLLKEQKENLEVELQSEEIESIKEKYYELKTHNKSLKKLILEYSEKEKQENDLSKQEILEEIKNISFQRETILKQNRNARSKKELETELYYLKENAPKFIEESEESVNKSINDLNVEIEILKRDHNITESTKFNCDLTEEKLKNMEQTLERKKHENFDNQTAIPPMIVMTEEELLEYQSINETIANNNVKIEDFFDDFMQEEKEEATKIMDTIDTFPYKKVSSSYVGENEDKRIFKRIDKDNVEKVQNFLLKIKNFDFNNYFNMIKILFDDLYFNSQMLKKYDEIIKNNELHTKLSKQKEENNKIESEQALIRQQLTMIKIKKLEKKIKKNEKIIEEIQLLKQIKSIENQLKSYKSSTSIEQELNELEDYLNELQEHLNYTLYIEYTNEYNENEKTLQKYKKQIENQKQYKDYKNNLKLLKDYTESLEYSLKYENNLSEIESYNNDYKLKKDYEDYEKLKDTLSIIELKLQRDELKDELNTITNILVPLQEQYNQCETDLVSAKETLSIINEKLNTLKNTSNKIKTIIGEIKDIEIHLKMLEEYDKIISNKGLPSKILYDIIKSIEYYINNVITSFINYKLEFLFDYDKQYLEILCTNTKTQKMLSFQRLSGYEKCVVRLALKRAINKFSCNAKSSIILIDEAFDCIDEENFIKKLPQLISLISDDYEIAMVISQRDLSHVANKVIKIKNNTITVK